MLRSWTIAVCSLSMLAGCAETEPNDEPLVPGVDVLGNEGHTTDSVIIEVLATEENGLNRVMDLDFNPEVPGELWTVNANDDSVVLIHNATSDSPTIEKIIDPYALHFMDNVSAISFGKPGFFATTQESANTYNGEGDPNEFMGPTLWPSDLDLFGQSNPEAVDMLSTLYGMYVDLGSHFDMLHDSPLATGIEWSHANAYWVFDGYHNAISLQDFKEDHGMGYDYHSDGEILRYVSGEVARANRVTSGMSLDKSTDLLYISDSGNGRIAVLDTTSGTVGARLPQCDEYPYPVHNEMDDAVITTLVDDGIDTPSGMVRYGDYLLVGDNETGFIHAYTLDGDEVDYLDTGYGKRGIQGLAIGPDQYLYVATGNKNEVIRIKPLSAGQ